MFSCGVFLFILVSQRKIPLKPNIKAERRPNQTSNNEYMSDSEILTQFSVPATRNFAFNQLVKTYQQKVYWHIRKMVIDHDDADDLTQETFIKAWKGLDNFKGESQLFTWLYRIATNESLNHLTKKKRRFFVPINDISEELSNKLEDSDMVSGDEVQMKLQKALLT